MALASLDQQEVDGFARTFEELFDRGDAAAMAAFNAQDAEVIASDSDLVQGRHTIEAFLTAASQAAQRTECNEPSRCGRWNAQAASAMC